MVDHRCMAFVGYGERPTNAEMRVTTTEDLAISIKGGSILPQDGPSKENNGARLYKTIPSTKKCEAPTSPRPTRLKLFHKKMPSGSGASSSHIRKSSSFYAGPQPTRIDGCPLRSCLKKTSTSGTSTTSSDTCCSSRRVSFSHVQVREYCRQAGDNPSVTSGCPLAIGWKYNRRGKLDIDTYEADRDKDPVPCQRLSAKERAKLLSEIGGVSESQIIQGQIQAYFDGQLRAETLDQIGGLKNCKSIGPRERLFIMKESAARKLDRAKKGVSDTQEQQKLWDDAHEAARRRSLERTQNP